MILRGKHRTTLPTKLDEDFVICFNKTEQLKDLGYSKILRLRNTTDVDELRDMQHIEQNGKVSLKNNEELMARWRILMNQLRKPRTN